MIDLQREQLLPLSRVPEYLAGRGVTNSEGSPISLKTVYLWVANGALETVKIGRLHTSHEALARMGEAASEQVTPNRRPRKQRVSRETEERHQRDLAELRARGFKI